MFIYERAENDSAFKSIDPWAAIWSSSNPLKQYPEVFVH